MTETFEDRLFEALIDEVRHPSLPSFEEASGQVRPAPIGGRRRRRWAEAVAVAAGVALLAGGVIVLSGSDGVPVRTSDVAAPTAQASTFLTFGDPVGEVYRSSVVSDPRPVLSYRPVAEPSWRIDVATGPASDLLSQLTLVAVVGGRDLRSLTLPESGGKPFGVFFWMEPDGSIWSITASSSALGDIEDEHDLQKVRGVVEHLLGQLDYAHGEFTAGPDFESFVPLDRAPRAWVISDDEAVLAAIEDSTTDVEGLPGERTTVRGHVAVFGDGVLRWRESPERILELSLIPGQLQADDERRLPIEQRDPVIVDVPTLPDLQSIADRLVESDRATYEHLRLLRGARVERVVVMPPSGSEAVSVNVESAGSSTDVSVTMTKVVGSDGWAIDPVSSGPDPTGYWIWAAGTSVTGGGQRPACAQYVAVPPDGEPAVTVVVDPTCIG